MKAGTVVPLAVSTAARAKLLPNVQAIRERGYPDIAGSAWIGFVGPGRMPKAIAERVSKEISDVLREPEVAETLRRQMMEPAPTSPDEFALFMHEELQRWKPVILQNKIKAD